jgi:CRP-like cAMP-binding protein
VVEALQRHLSAFAELSDNDHALIASLASRNLREAAPRRDIVREGEKPTGVLCILEGWAAVYKQLPDGRRQITAFLIPGDLADANVFIVGRMDHSICAITPVRYAEIPPTEFEAMTDASPSIARALWRQTLVNGSISREWVLNIGQRTAYERLAHLLCEMFLKLKAAGLADESGCDWPLTQVDLAEATGLTSVHVNRTLQQMRRDGLIELQGRRLTIPDLRALMRVALFDPDYLHLEAPPA